MNLPIQSSKRVFHRYNRRVTTCTRHVTESKYNEECRRKRTRVKYGSRY